VQRCGFVINRILGFLLVIVLVRFTTGLGLVQGAQSQSSNAAPQQPTPPVVCTWVKWHFAGRDYRPVDVQEHLTKFLSDPGFGVKPEAVKEGDTRYCDYLLTIESDITLGVPEVKYTIETTGTAGKRVDEGRFPISNKAYYRVLVFDAVDRAASDAVRALKLRKSKKS
jgi:hypothetical protein